MEVNIDFDEASRAWRKNKTRVGQSYKYVCSVDGCMRYCCKDIYATSMFCIWHNCKEDVRLYESPKPIVLSGAKKGRTL